MVKPLLFIYNPISGKGRIRAELSRILDIFTRRGWLVTAYPTQAKGDAARMAAALAPSYEQVVCSGGDGTLSETVSGLMRLEQAPPVGYIPAGSTNDCAATLRLPRDLLEAAEVAAGAGRPCPWDIGRLNGRSFVYVAAFGAFTSVAYETPQDLKNTFGHLAYIMGGVAAIPSITPFHLKIEYDGLCVEGEFYYGMVCNTISVAGMKALPADQVKLDDGLFEVVLVRKPTSVADVYGSLQALVMKTPPEEGAILSFHASALTITADRPIPWTLDGEFGGRHAVSHVENRCRALTILQGD